MEDQKKIERRLSLIKDGYLVKEHKYYSKKLQEDFHLLAGEKSIEKLSSGNKKHSQTKLDISKLDNHLSSLGHTLLVAEKGSTSSPAAHNSKWSNGVFKVKIGSCFSTKTLVFEPKKTGEFIIEHKGVKDSLFKWPSKVEGYDYRIWFEDLGEKNNLFVYSSELNDLKTIKNYFLLEKFDSIAEASLLLKRISIKSKVLQAESVYRMIREWNISKEIEFELTQTERSKVDTKISLRQFQFESIKEEPTMEDRYSAESLKELNMIVSKQSFGSINDLDGSGIEIQSMRIPSSRTQTRNTPFTLTERQSYRSIEETDPLQPTPNIQIQLDSLEISKEISWISPTVVFQLLELVETRSLNKLQEIGSSELSIMYDNKKEMIVYSSSKCISFIDDLTKHRENTIEMAICNTDVNGKRRALFSTEISLGSLIAVNKMGCCLCIPFLFDGYPGVVILRPSIKIEGEEKKYKTEEFYLGIRDRLRDKAIDIANGLKDVGSRLDEFIEEVIKKKNKEKALDIYNIALPSSILLNLWLIISKKCKFTMSTANETDKNSSKSDESKKFKSTIMRSLYFDSLELNKKSSKVKRNTIFEILLNNLENLSRVENESLNNSYFGIVEKHRGEYFFSKINKRKVFEHFILHIMGDYYDMSHSSANNTTHLLFAQSPRSSSRDYLVIVEYAHKACPRLSRWLQGRMICIGILLSEKLLNSNLEWMKDPGAQYYCNTLFLLSVQNRDVRGHEFGWRYLLFTTLCMLDRLEQQCINQAWEYDPSMSLEKMIGLIESNSRGAFRDEVLKEYIETIQSIKSGGKSIFSLVKDTVLGTSVVDKISIMNSVQDNKSYRVALSGCSLVNAGIYEIIRTKVSLNSLVALVKPQPDMRIRRLHFMFHKILTKRNKIDKYSFNIILNESQNKHMDGQYIVIEFEEEYPPMLEFSLLTEGDNILFDDNFVTLAKAKLQTKRFRTNVIHSMILSLVSVEDISKRYLVSCSLLIQEEAKGAIQTTFSTSLDMKYNKGLGFKETAQQYRPPGLDHSMGYDVLAQALIKDFSKELEDADADISHQIFCGLYNLEATRRDRLCNSLSKLKGCDNISFLQKGTSSKFNSLELVIKLCLFTKRHDKFIEYLFKYFSLSVNSLTYNDLVVAIREVLNILGMEPCDTELIQFIETYIRRDLSLKLVSASLLLGQNKLEAKHREDITNIITALIYNISFQQNSRYLPIGVGSSAKLIQNIVTKLGLTEHLEGVNSLILRYKYMDQEICEIIEFDQNFQFSQRKTKKKPVLARKDPIERLMTMNSHSVNLGVVHGERVSITEFLRLTEESALLEYAKYVTESLQF